MAEAAICLSVSSPLCISVFRIKLKNKFKKNKKPPIAKSSVFWVCLQSLAHASPVKIWIKATQGAAQVKRNKYSRMVTRRPMPQHCHCHAVFLAGLPASPIGPAHQDQSSAPRHRIALASESQDIIFSGFQVVFLMEYSMMNALNQMNTNEICLAKKVMFIRLQGRASGP